MFFNTKKERALGDNQPLYTIIEIENKVENCGACGMEIETYYHIQNTLNGKKEWINKRFAGQYGLK